MATLVFSAVGAAVGAGFGGTVLGLSGAVIGRAVGATLGRAVDQRILGGSEAVEVGRIDRLRLTGASDGAPIPRLWGRMRIAGQVIWAAPFEEHAARRRGGKGGGPTVTDYSYSVSLAIGLCAGRILKVGRIWADGVEIAPETLTLRVYPGDEDQLPDPKIEVVTGAGLAPAYRGLAYVVLEDLDLTPFGNRVPQFSFEVMREAQGGALGEETRLSDVVRAVAMIPGTGEYALATTPVHLQDGLGQRRSVNVNAATGMTDFAGSLADLTAELPNCGSASLVVSWFGDDLRCGQCSIRPLVEGQTQEGVGMAWRAGGIARAEAGLVPQIAGSPVYGGTPADQAVIEAIRAIRATGRAVMFYPFILMTQLAGNTLTDPFSGQPGQPVLPWRGRITTALAPGLAGSTDRTAAARGEVAAFFGTAAPGDFTTMGEVLSYAGPADWGLRRFILHYAHLCQIAGGVDAFCIGSEMRGLTRIRDEADGFPAVAALRVLAAEVKAILGAGTQVSYAADWSEYGSYVIGADVHFPLDPLWADPAVDFIGIDNYMPLSDWRDGPDHADAHWGSIHDLGYLRANVAGGEGFHWYYDSPEGEAAQVRLPITDGAHDEPWIYRSKDLKSWWGLAHHARIGGARQAGATAWVPMSKPIVFTEYGCAAIDKGTNQPNRFLDRLSSESALPRASNGARDDLVQMQYLRAMAAHWGDGAENPVSPLYGGRMVDMDRAHVWAWDTRPFPAFPGRGDLWADAVSYPRGHWLNGRAVHQPLGAVLREICGDAVPLDTGAAQGVVRGYVLDQVQSARAGVQPLLLAHGVDALDRGGAVRFRRRLPGLDHRLDPAAFAVAEGLEQGLEQLRAPIAEVPPVIRLAHVDADGVYDIRTAEARQPEGGVQAVSAQEYAMALTGAEGRGITARWLAETRIARDGLRLALPPGRLDVGAGDRLELPDGSRFRVDRVEQADLRLIEAQRIEDAVYAASDLTEDLPELRPYLPPLPVDPVFLDLPLLTGDEVPHDPHLAVVADPWPGPVALWSDSGAGGFGLDLIMAAPAIMGVTENALVAAPPGLWDRGPALRVRMVGGGLAAASPEAVLNGANAMAIGDGSAGRWEVFQFAGAELVAPGTWDLSQRLRGQSGTDGIMPASWPVGSMVVLLDRSLRQIGLAANARGLPRRYRIGVAARGHDDAHVTERTEAFQGVGLRPYAVAHLRLRGRAGQDVDLRWIRRTRIDGDNWQQLEVPLGEEGEGYVLRVMQGAAVLRDYTLTTPAFSYPAAAQAADGVTGAFTLAVAQVSARFGAGPFRQVSVPL